jgi:hypothetical protein
MWAKKQLGFWSLSHSVHLVNELTVSGAMRQLDQGAMGDESDDDDDGDETGLTCKYTEEYESASHHLQ